MPASEQPGPKQGQGKVRPLDATVAFTESSQPEDHTDSFALNESTHTVRDQGQAPVSVTSQQASDLMSRDKKITQPIVIGDFEVTQKLGQGGMGAVFRARQISLDREVALKVLARHLAENKEYVTRFYREAKVMAKLDHDHIVRCFQVGEFSGLHYLAMEFVDGGSLQSWLDKLGKFSVGDAVHAALACAYALDHAHEMNLIHRDIKPDNMLISRKGVLKVADMGLAKPTDDDLSLTQTGVGAGTPHFMSPEQMRNAKDVDGRADIYALGCMLYYMLTGEKPFKGQTLVELIKEKEIGKFTPARRLNPEVPDRLDLMIDKMIDKNIKTRYQTCAELIKDLENGGWANERLSFLGTEVAAPQTKSMIRKAGEPSSSKLQAPSVEKPSGDNSPKPPSIKTTLAASSKEPTPAEDIWYIAMGMVDGKRRVKKMTTFQVFDQINAGQLESNHEASRHAQTGYRALATYAEFQKLLQLRNKKAAIKRETVLTSAEAQNISREAVWYLRLRWLRRFFSDMMGWVYLFIGLAVIGAIAYVVYLNWPTISSTMQQHMPTK